MRRYPSNWNHVWSVVETSLFLTTAIIFPDMNNFFTIIPQLKNVEAQLNCILTFLSMTTSDL